MAFNPAPNALFPSWSEDGTTIEVPIASFPELTAAEADGATGDSRKVVYALLQKIYAAIQALPEGDRPTQMRVSRAQTLSQTNPAQIFMEFNIGFTLAAASVDVAAE